MIFLKAIFTALALSHYPNPSLASEVGLISFQSALGHLCLDPNHTTDTASNCPLLMKMSLALIFTAVFFRAKMVTVHRKSCPLSTIRQPRSHLPPQGGARVPFLSALLVPSSGLAATRCVCVCVCVCVRARARSKSRLG